MRRIYFIGLILYTLIVLHVAFPNIFSFEDVETVHIGIFIFILFVVDCCISIWLSKRKHVQDKKKWNEKEKTFILDDDVLFVFSAYCCLFSEHIPIERLNIGFGAFVFAYYFSCIFFLI